MILYLIVIIFIVLGIFFDKELFSGGHYIKIFFIFITLVTIIYSYIILLKPITQGDAAGIGMTAGFKVIGLYLIILGFIIGWLIHFVYINDKLKIYMLLGVLSITIMYFFGIDRIIYKQYNKIISSVFFNKYPITSLDLNFNYYPEFKYYRSGISINGIMQNGENVIFLSNYDIKSNKIQKKYNKQLLLKKISISYSNVYGLDMYESIDLDIDKQRKIFENISKNSTNIKGRFVLNIDKNHNTSFGILIENDKFYNLASIKPSMRISDKEMLENLTIIEKRNWLLENEVILGLNSTYENHEKAFSKLTQEQQNRINYYLDN